VELLVVISLLGIVMIAMTRFLFSQTNALNRQTELFAVRQDARSALHRLSSDIRLVGRGLNRYDIKVPDLIVPNDGSVSVNTYTDSTISLLSIPDPSVPGRQLVLDSLTPGNGKANSTRVVVDSSSSTAGVGNGTRVILFDPNTGNSQVVTTTSVVSDTIKFVNDTLTFTFPSTGASPSLILLLNEVRYRVNRTAGIPYLERRVNDGAWVRFIEGVANLQFAYYDSTANPFKRDPTAFKPDTPRKRRAIRWIRITLTGESIRSTPSGKRSRVTLNTDVAPRNMLPRK